MKLQQIYSKSWRLGAPYFKDTQYYFSPLNVDTLRKKENNELSVYDFVMTQKWSSTDCEKMVSSVTFNYNLNLQMAIKKEIATLTRNGITNGDNEQIRELQRQLERFDDNKTEWPPLNSDEHIDWERISEKFLNTKYSAFECRSFWHMYLHPKINKNQWTAKEDSNLKQLVTKYRFQNWSEISESLGSKRTCLQVCKHYFTDLHRHFKVGSFTQEEDDLLISLIRKYQMGNHIPWAKIVKHFKDRKRTQLYQRYVLHNYISQLQIVTKLCFKIVAAWSMLVVIPVDHI
ncbi:unnamed protein product [Acanthoscelides obtectus]|uniref:Uncharacterized protein n=1 Tax=Acanthoscelides obtectus TaxID=200917 RepID=A0A9P0KQK4_ACAOB|nr:unnamed protein product [Acanthoscelides obtectus]CAK1656188.1 snRNA-activating protein complex subunit 4 [Acanthoscelides obtectus]